MLVCSIVAVSSVKAAENPLFYELYLEGLDYYEAENFKQAIVKLNYSYSINTSSLTGYYLALSFMGDGRQEAASRLAWIILKDPNNNLGSVKKQNLAELVDLADAKEDYVEAVVRTTSNINTFSTAGPGSPDLAKFVALKEQAEMERNSLEEALQLVASNNGRTLDSIKQEIDIFGTLSQEQQGIRSMLFDSRQ